MSETENTTQLPFKQSHAFIIGINDYQHVSTLTTAVKDASDIADLLEDKGKHGYTVHRYLNPTKAKMEEAFQSMKDLVQPDDRVIFYFAGHGIAHDSEGDPEGFIVPADAKTGRKETLISMNVLHKALTELPCKHGLLILDCCFAGAFKWSTGFRDLVASTPETLYAERFWRFVEHPAWQVITSSAHDQKAADVLNKETLGLREEEVDVAEDKNSPFAWALKQAIDLDSKADTSGYKRSDGVVTATELYLYLREIVETATLENGKRQSPAIFTLGKHDTKGEYIFLNPGHKLNLPEAPNRNPYKGLGAYEPTEADAQTFFGRTQAIKDMANKLEHNSILVVSAPSGQGKSSTVKAGLFPHLQQQGYARLTSLRPGDRAFDTWEALRDLDPTQKQLVLIDQYEEMFALEKTDRTFFEEILMDVLDKLQGVKLILTIRSDFEWQLQTSDFGQNFWQETDIRNFLYRLPPMSLEELKEIMIKPAWVVAYEFESDELIDQILEEINHAPGALPLLSFTLHKLFELRDRDKRLLTKKAYQEELGGVNGALSKHADRIYLNLPSPAHQDFARKLLLRMVRLNDGSYSRRRVYLKTPSRKSNHGFIDELNYPDHLDATKDEVLKILEDALLLSNGKDKYGPYVEPMHDSLINFWPRCLQWIQGFGRGNLVLQRDTWKAVVEHHQWEKNIYGTPDGREPKAPLWDNNPKLQQIQIAVTDPKDEWLCKKGWADKSISSISYLLWERKPTSDQMEEMGAWNWFFQANDPQERYQKIQTQMDHWLNEEELAFVKHSFEEQRSELERIKAERNEAIKAKERAEELAHNLGMQTVAFKQKYQQRSKRDLLLIQLGLKPQLHLIMIGIDKYKAPIPVLNSCVNDVLQLSAVIQQQEGKLYEKVHFHKLVDEEATKDNIIQKVRKVRGQAREFDHVIIYMGGHGSFFQEEHHTGKKIVVGEFIPYHPSTRGRLSGKDFIAELLPFQSTVILLLDFCHGSEFLQPLTDANQSRDIEALTNNIFALSGTSLGQTAFEVIENGEPRGVFSFALQQCFNTREADLDGNEMVYLDEIVQYTTSYIEGRSSSSQHPIGVIPATQSNIPLVQFGDTFALPKRELALGGHIEEDHVIKSIVQNFADDWLKDILSEKGFDHFIEDRFKISSNTSTR